MLVVIAINKCSALVDTLFVDASDEVKRMTDPLKALFKFLFDCASNLLVQTASTMVGQLVTTAVQETNDVVFVGGFYDIVDVDMAVEQHDCFSLDAFAAAFNLLII